MAESITCPQCQRTSFHPMDVREGYCGHCNWWTSQTELAALRRDRPCPDRQPHTGHEWFDTPPALRLECPGAGEQPPRKEHTF